MVVTRRGHEWVVVGTVSTRGWCRCVVVVVVVTKGGHRWMGGWVGGWW